MLNLSQAPDIFTVFAKEGFRKVTMGSIADAIGVSRQSIYNWHGSKEAVLKWALATFLNEITDLSIAEIESSAEDALDRLHAGFQAWTGDHIEMVRGTPHGSELLESAVAAVAKSERDYKSEFADAVTRFLIDHGLAEKASEADALNLILQSASMGLLLTSKSNEDYAKGMRLVLNTMLSS